MNRMESELTLVVQTVMERINIFNDEDVTRFLEVNKYEMASRGATGVQMVSHINPICTLDVPAKVTKLCEKFHEGLGFVKHCLMNTCYMTGLECQREAFLNEQRK